MTRTAGRFAAGAALMLVQAGIASAAEIKVFSTVGVKGVVEELFPKFEAASGNKVSVTWSTGNLLAKRIHDGEMADVLIAAPANIEALVKEGKLVPGSPGLLSRVIFAVAVKKGAPKPDISTPEAFRQSLLAARAVSYTNPAAGGQSGVYFAKQLDRMGIAEQVKEKSKFPPAGGFAGTLLVNGEADIAIQSKPELMSVSGVEIVGPLPGDMAFTSAHMAVVGSGAKDAAAAKALIEFLRSPEAQTAFKAKGYDPP